MNGTMSRLKEKETVTAGVEAVPILQEVHQGEFIVLIASREVGAEIMMISLHHHHPVVDLVEEGNIVHHITAQLVVVDTPNLTTTTHHLHTPVDMEDIRDHLTITPLVTTDMVAEEEVVCQADEIIVLVLNSSQDFPLQ